ncbi:MAG: hypothetical protein P8X92_04735 [Dehalococcoidia bacterium]
MPNAFALLEFLTIDTNKNMASQKGLPLQRGKRKTSVDPFLSIIGDFDSIVVHAGHHHSHHDYAGQEIIYGRYPIPAAFAENGAEDENHDYWKRQSEE